MKVIDSKSIITINKHCSLFHGMSLDRAIQVIKRGAMKAYTPKRFWDNGVVKKDSQKGYNDSKWLFGWSFSRCRNVSAKFGDVIFAFDRKKINYNFKIIPFSWNYSFKYSFDKFDFSHKKEKEDFVSNGYYIESESYYENLIEKIDNEISKLYKKYLNNSTSEKDKKEILKIINKKEDIIDSNNFNKIFQSSHGKELSLSLCYGFFVKKECLNNPMNHKYINDIINNSLFLGFI